MPLSASCWDYPSIIIIIMRKEPPWKEVLAIRNEDEREKCLEIESKKEVQEQFERNMNQDLNEKKLFWKEVSKANGTWRIPTE